MTVSNLDTNYQAPLIIDFIDKKWQYDAVILVEVLQLSEAVLELVLVIELASEIRIEIHDFLRRVASCPLEIERTLDNKMHFFQHFKVYIDYIFIVIRSLCEFLQIILVDLALVQFKYLSHMVVVLVVVRKLKVRVLEHLLVALETCLLIGVNLRVADLRHKVNELFTEHLV